MIQGKQLCQYCVLLRLFGIKALRNTDSQLWLYVWDVYYDGQVNMFVIRCV